MSTCSSSSTATATITSALGVPNNTKTVQPVTIIPSSNSSKQRKTSNPSKSLSTTISTLTIATTAAAIQPTVNLSNSSVTSSIKTISTSSSAKDKEKHHIKSVGSKVGSSSKGHDKEMTTREKSSKRNSKDDVTNNSSSRAPDTKNSSIGASTSSSSRTNSNVTMASVKEISVKDSSGVPQKFTTSNFTESIVVNSDSVFGGGDSVSIVNANVKSTMAVAKKRKADGSKNSSANSSLDNIDINKDLIKDVSVTLVPLTSLEMDPVKKVCLFFINTGLVRQLAVRAKPELVKNLLLDLWFF